MIVYKITNDVNDKIYVGQTTKSLEVRFRYHCYKENGCRYLKNAIQKYGSEHFKIEAIEECDSKEELDEREKYWIEHFNSIVPNGYNLKSGGNTPIYSEESRRRMSENHCDCSGENNSNYGKHLSEKTRRKISNSHKGKSLSEQTKEILRARSPKNKKVIDLTTGVVYPSSRCAERTMNLSHGTISVVCRGKGKTAGGHQWKYVEGGDATWSR